MPQLRDEFWLKFGDSVKYGHLLTLNSPHLGVQSAALAQRWRNLVRFCELHKQVTLRDQRLGDHHCTELGILEEMADPDGSYIQSLALFRHRTAVAATHWDLPVPFCSAA